MQHATTSREHDIGHDREEIDRDKNVPPRLSGEKEEARIGMHLVIYLSTPSK
jgi:hypothetical protein